MLKTLDDIQFRPINQAYNAVFRPNRLTLGLVVPIEAYARGPVPTLERHAMLHGFNWLKSSGLLPSG